MSRYIDAEVAKAMFNDTIISRAAKSIIDDCPTADVEEVRHGHWIHSTKEVGVELCHRWQCSECGRAVARLNESAIEDLPYCHCGAKMDGERREE